MRRADLAHLALMLLALIIAYVLPFELLVLSYAILGPAHYLTEISWLHDRNYFLPQRSLAILLALAALGAMFIANLYWYGVLVAVCLLACAALVLARTQLQSLLLLAGVGFITLLACQGGAPFFAIGVLLTTFIHVSLFTLIFMLVGARRAKSAFLFGLVGLYLASIAAILLVPPTAAMRIPALAAAAQDYFGSVAPTLGAMFGVPHLAFAGRVTGLLSFVYTYHYLNWFVKVDVIRWADVPRPRLIAIAAASAASTALYFYNYAIGFMVLLLLSLMHILLEFPLNTISIRDLAGSFTSAKASSRKPARAAR